MYVGYKNIISTLYQEKLGNGVEMFKGCWEGCKWILNFGSGRETEVKRKKPCIQVIKILLATLRELGVMGTMVNELKVLEYLKEEAGGLRIFIRKKGCGGQQMCFSEPLRSFGPVSSSKTESILREITR